MAVIELTKDNFTETIEGNGTVIVDFWATWCGPCRAFAPIFEKASAKHEDVVFAKIDTDAQKELAAAFQIRSIPTLMAFRENIAVFHQAGMMRPKQLDELVEKVGELDMDEVRRQIAEHEAADAAEAAKDSADSDGEEPEVETPAAAGAEDEANDDF